MSGNRYLLDTNGIIALLKQDSDLIKLLQSADWVGISIISQIEFLAFAGLSEADKQLFQQFLQRVEIINLDHQNSKLIEQIILIRQNYKLKLPDAIIAAMAIQNSAKLVSRDVQLKKVTELTVTDW